MPVMTRVMIVLQRLHGLMAVHASCSSRRAWRRTWWSTGGIQSTTLSGELWHLDQTLDVPGSLASCMSHLASSERQSPSLLPIFLSFAMSGCSGLARLLSPRLTASDGLLINSLSRRCRCRLFSTCFLALLFGSIYWGLGNKRCAARALADYYNSCAPHSSQCVLTNTFDVCYIVEGALLGMLNPATILV